MRSIEDKEVTSGSTINFEFNKGNGAIRGGGGGGGGGGSSHHLHRTALGKPTPSKWDDAQKWLAGLSRGGGGGGGGGDKKTSSRTKPRNSNADDTRLIAPVPQHDNDYPTEEEEVVDHQVLEKREDAISGSSSLSSLQFDVQTKNVDCEESYWRVNSRPVESCSSVVGVRSVSVRDMGTEMTPSVSLEPSRTATPIRATTPVRRSPIASGASTPVNCQHHGVRNQSIAAQTHQQNGPSQMSMDGNRGQACSSPLGIGRGSEAVRVDVNSGSCGDLTNSSSAEQKMNPLETRAIAWDEAERAKYMARYKREEVKIQAWENHEKRKAEMEMRKMEAKAERLRARAQEKYANKLASTRRIAEEKRANAEAKLNEKAVKTSEKADYIRSTGHLPSTLCCRLPSILCCTRLSSFSSCW